MTYPDSRFLADFAPEVSDKITANVDVQSNSESHQHKLNREAIDTVYADGRPYRGSGKLDGKVAWISGGDSGIGRATAMLFAIEGARGLTLVYLEAEQKDAEDTRDAIKKHAPECKVQLLPSDLKNEDNCIETIEACAKEFGQIDVLLNNSAQQLENNDVTTLPSQQWLDCFQLNMHSYFFASKAAIPHMPKGSSIINMCSINAFIGRPDLLEYTSTKGAIVSFTRGLSNQILEKKQIRVNSIAPGPIWTPLIPSTFSKDKIKEFTAPMGRPGQPIEVATCCVFLASQDSSFISGNTLHPNGGTVSRVKGSNLGNDLQRIDMQFKETCFGFLMTAPALSSSTRLDIAVAADDLDTQQTTSIDWEELYEMEATAKSIRDGGFRCVALQFPDEMLQDSVRVYRALRQRLEAAVSLYVLADTTYGSCCVDEVAAEHVNADLVVHYGHSCLSATARLPALLVFTKRPLDVDAASQAIQSYFENNPTIVEGKTSIQLRFDVAFEWKMDQLHTALSAWLTTPVRRQLINKADFLDKRSSPGQADTTGCCQSGCSCAVIRSLPGNDHTTTKVEESDIPKDSLILYIGPESLRLSHLTMTNTQTAITCYAPARDGATGEVSQGASTSRLLMRRYAAIQKAKDADVFGIVVGTLGVASYLPLVSQIRKRLRSNLKKVYTLCVGKPNPAKLANYQEIEAFVLVACPENSLLLTSPDSTREYLRPIITPWELEVALDGNFTWSDGWRLDWATVLSANASQKSKQEKEDVTFSDATGKLRTVRKFYNKDDTAKLSEQVESLALIQNDSNREIARILGSAAGQHLDSLTYKGLDPRYDQDRVESVQQGRSGVARGYIAEKNEEGALKQ